MTVTIVPKKRKDGKVGLKIRSIVNRKVNYRDTGIVIEPEFVYPKPKYGKYIKAGHAQAEYYNNVLSQLVREREDELKQGKTPGFAGRMSFFNHANHYMELVKAKNYNTWKRFNSHVNSLIEFTKGDIVFLQMDYEFLQKFEIYLREKNNSLQTINAKMKSIRAIFYDAIRAGKVGQHLNPFFNYKLPNSKTKKERLAPKEIKAIQNLFLPFMSQIDLAKDCFLFAFYCRGMRVGDVLTLRRENVKGDILTYTMLKTKTTMKVHLLPEALAIIDKYVNQDSNYLLPVLRHEYDNQEELYKAIGSSTALLNARLKEIAGKCGITIRLTTHIARHSFASLARNSGVDIYKIKEMMGHGNVKISENYLESITEDEMKTEMVEMYKNVKTA